MMPRRLFTDLLVPALLGGLATLGFAPWNIYPATLAALIGALVLWRGVGSVRGAWRGFIFGCAMFGNGVYWIYLALHTYGGVAWPLAVLAVATLVAYLALYPALVGAFAGLTRRVAAPAWALLIVPAAWGLCELLRGWVGSGFPWLSLGYVTIGAPLNGLAPLVGIYGLSIALMIAAGTLWLLYSGGLAARLIALALIAILPVVIWGLPSPTVWTRPTGKLLQVAVIQGNVDQGDRWRQSGRASTLALYADLTRRTHADLVVWPAVAIPASADHVKPYLTRVGNSAGSRHQTVLAGILRSADHGKRLYNSVLALGEGSDQGRDQVSRRYNKPHSVSFGGYVPGPDWLLGGLRDLGLPISRIAAGADRQRLIHSHGVALGVSIGFEDLFPAEIARDLSAAGVLVSVANDAWFTGTPAPARYLAQYLEVARMHALESGRPMVRAANTGISAIIGFDGRIQHRAPIDRTARLVGEITPRRGLTPYMKYGDTLLWWATLVIVCLGVLGAAGQRLLTRLLN